VRALEAEMKALSLHLAGTLAEPSAVYHVLDTTLIPAVVRVRACRRALFAGQATFGRSASKTEWVYGLKVGLSVSPEGVITTFCLAEASADERPVAEILIHKERHAAYLAEKGFASVGWERHWLSEYGALVAATPKDNSKRAWDAAGRLWAAGKRQIVEGVINQLSRTSSSWSATGLRASKGFWLVWRRRSPRTPAGSASTLSSVVLCAAWPIC
jgi:Transposase DDE domain